MREALGVSADWLLGLSDRPEPAAEVLSANFRMATAQRTPADEQIIAWHQEAAGHKIRHVPATLPDILKTEAVLEWEYAAFLDKTPEQARGAMRETSTGCAHRARITRSASRSTSSARWRAAKATGRV
jgi:hypothetical protein